MSYPGALYPGEYAPTGTPGATAGRLTIADVSYGSVALAEVAVGSVVLDHAPYGTVTLSDTAAET